MRNSILHNQTSSTKTLTMPYLGQRHDGAWGTITSRLHAASDGIDQLGHHFGSYFSFQILLRYENQMSVRVHKSIQNHASVARDGTEGGSGCCVPPTRSHGGRMKLAPISTNDTVLAARFEDRLNHEEPTHSAKLTVGTSMEVKQTRNVKLTYQVLPSVLEPFFSANLRSCAALN